MNKAVLYNSIIASVVTIIVAILVAKMFEYALPYDNILVNNPIEQHLLLMYNQFGFTLLAFAAFGLLNGVLHDFTSKYIRM